MNGLPGGHGAVVLAADMRSVPEDFVVEELSGFDAAGQGEHLLLTVQKRGLTTVQAARRIAHWAGIAEMGVGYAGMKDRHAVTRQRFSVHLPKRIAPDLQALQDESLQVLDHAWHNRKLPRGALRGNRFELLLRNVRGEPGAIEARLKAIASGGLPNYFGGQRFGRDGDNVESARRMFAGQRVRREQRSIYLSAARSEMFNAVLAARVAAGDWATGREGEVWMLDGSQSVFGPEPPSEALSDRAARLDIHPTGPLWGLGGLRSDGAVRELEQSTLEPFGDLRLGLEKAGLKQERRALRVRVGALAWQWPAPDQLALAFELPPGAYATGLLAELGEARDAHSGA